jgi:hypothetical protein
MFKPAGTCFSFPLFCAAFKSRAPRPHKVLGGG